MTKPDIHKNDPETTGHVWDGIREFDNPLPRWWLWTFIICIIWGVGYTIAYPAWPLIGGATPGLLGYSSRQAVAEDIQRYEDANAGLNTRIAAADLGSLETDTELLNYALNGGAAVFRTWCAQCHGAGANGVKMGSGYANLIDDDWLWGGSIEAIHQTISHGIREESDDDTRSSEMPKFGEVLESGEIAQLVEYVRSVSGQEHDAGMAGAGQVLFADNCVACHGEDARGNREFGAPNLTDAIWLYGGDKASLTTTITKARFGVMPAWTGKLSESQIRQVAVYIHQSGGGE